MEIHLANIQGFCAGVSRAIQIVKSLLEKYGNPLYVRHHIVHNTAVIEGFEKQGVIFVDDLNDVPEGQRIVFSAHGVSQSVYDEAKSRGLIPIDATCPLVTKVHKEAKRFSEQNIQTVLIGHRKHQEIIGTAGYVKQGLLFYIEKSEDVKGLVLDTTKQCGYLTQTTLSVTEAEKIITKLKEKYPKMIDPAKEDICFATQNRQDAVIELAKFCDVIIVCGSPTSSNSNRLKETAALNNVNSYIIDNVNELNLEWLVEKHKIGISSGASVPAIIVDNVVRKISEVYPNTKIFQEESMEKDIIFDIPKI
jgi:4-hydroxy-3-methylbut-2-en-1-yl diphosphate reductase